MTLVELFTSIANAIRNKKGTADKIKAEDFASEIQNLPSGASFQSKSIEITENGTSTVQPDSGFDGLSQVQITTNVSAEGAKPLFTGHADIEGLKQIGWTDEDIDFFKNYCITWDEEYDELFKLTDAELLGDESSNTRFLPKNTTLTNFEDFQKLMGIPEINTSNVKSATYMFYKCYSLTMIPRLDLPNATGTDSMLRACRSLLKIDELNLPKTRSLNYMCAECYSLKAINNLNTTDIITGMSFAFRSCYSLKILPQIDATSVVNLSSAFSDCASLEHFGGLKNIGQAYSTTASANNSNYSVDLSYSNLLTHDSLMNVINNLYDIATKGCETQRLKLGTTNLAKLTNEEKAIATTKGWTLS